MPSLRNVLAGTVFTSLLGGGVAFSYKQNLVGGRKRELVAEKEALQQELRDQLSKVTVAEAEGGDIIAAEQKRRNAYQTMWDDRISRYHHSNLEALSYLHGLPEALGAMKGLVNHYRYVAEELRHFVGFDVASSKVHNFALLNETLLSNPRQRSSALMGLFASEPLIGEVARTLESIGAAPHSVEEVSKTFEFCIGDLERRMETVAKSISSEALSSRRPENMLVAATEELLEKLKVPTVVVKASGSPSTSLMRSLRDASDVKSALGYADDVLARLKAKSSDAAVERVRSHPLVFEGAAQLAAWQAGAATYLVEHQAHDALAAYQSLLSLSLVHQEQQR